MNHVYSGGSRVLSPLDRSRPFQHTDLCLNHSHLKNGQRLARGCGQKSWEEGVSITSVPEQQGSGLAEGKNQAAW